MRQRGQQRAVESRSLDWHLAALDKVCLEFTCLLPTDSLQVWTSHVLFVMEDALIIIISISEQLYPSFSV